MFRIDVYRLASIVPMTLFLAVFLFPNLTCASADDPEPPPPGAKVDAYAECKTNDRVMDQVDCETVASQRTLERLSIGWRAGAFLARGMKLTGEARQTNSANTGFKQDGAPVDFGTSESLRRISFGWKRKRFLEDLLVAFHGPKTVECWKKNVGACKPKDPQKEWKHPYQRIQPLALLLEGLTVDAYVARGRVIDFNETTPDLDDLKTATTWSVGVTCEVPIDKLLGIHY